MYYACVAILVLILPLANTWDWFGGENPYIPVPWLDFERDTPSDNKTFNHANVSIQSNLTQVSESGMGHEPLIGNTTLSGFLNETQMGFEVSTINTTLPSLFNTTQINAGHNVSWMEYDASIFNATQIEDVVNVTEESSATNSHIVNEGQWLNLSELVQIPKVLPYVDAEREASCFIRVNPLPNSARIFKSYRAQMAAFDAALIYNRRLCHHFYFGISDDFQQCNTTGVYRNLVPCLCYSGYWPVCAKLDGRFTVFKSMCEFCCAWKLADNKKMPHPFYQNLGPCATATAASALATAAPYDPRQLSNVNIMSFEYFIAEFHPPSN